VLFGYLAGLTERIEFATGIVILPQRQTVLVAKQAAALDVLSGGRLRLGIGIGWNRVEYEALGTDFHNRGRRCEEQVALLRALWTDRAVTFDGAWHRVTDAGLNPLPVQRPIPLWFGGGEERVLRRIARLADGWMPQFQPDEAGRALLARMHGYAREHGRDPAAIGLNGRMVADPAAAHTWTGRIRAWREIGATHLSIDTMRLGLRGVEQHVALLERFHVATNRAAPRTGSPSSTP
jgi:probable F420-dependent oxidoreductase